MNERALLFHSIHPHNAHFYYNITLCYYVYDLPLINSMSFYCNCDDAEELLICVLYSALISAYKSVRFQLLYVELFNIWVVLIITHEAWVHRKTLSIVVIGSDIQVAVSGFFFVILNIIFHCDFLRVNLNISLWNSSSISRNVSMCRSGVMCDHHRIYFTFCWKFQITFSCTFLRNFLGWASFF